MTVANDVDWFSVTFANIAKSVNHILLKVDYLNYIFRTDSKGLSSTVVTEFAPKLLNTAE